MAIDCLNDLPGVTALCTPMPVIVRASVTHVEIWTGTFICSLLHRTMARGTAHCAAHVKWTLGHNDMTGTLRMATWSVSQDNDPTAHQPGGS